MITMRDGKIVADEVKATPTAVEPVTDTQNRIDPTPDRAGTRTTVARDREPTTAAPSLGFIGMTLSSAAQAVGRNRLRSLLTALGVFIGVAALIAMVAVGRGANQAVEKQIESLGTNLLVVMPGATTAGAHVSARAARPRSRSVTRNRCVARTRPSATWATWSGS